MSTESPNAPSGQASTIDMSEKPSPARSLNEGSEVGIAAPGDQEKSRMASESTSSPPQITRAVKGWKWVLVCSGFYFSAFLYGLDNTIAADIQSAVVDTYGDISKLTWLGTGFPLGSIATILTFGKAYGIFNVKWLHIGSVTLFSVGSAICGAAPNMNALIVGRVIAGMGGAGMYLGLLNLITINTTIRERPAYMGAIGVVWGVGTILGPVIGGAFADSGATWRWAFYINLIIFGIMAPAFILIPSFQPQPGVATITKMKQLDWVGAVLWAGLYTSFVLALTFGGATWAWGSGRTIGTFVACFVILIVFGIQQFFSIFTTAERRLFPVEFLTSRTMILLHFLTASAGTSMFICIYYIPLMFQFSRGDSGVESAVRLLPFVMILIFFMMGSGWVIPYIGYYMPFYVVSGVFMLIGGALMYTVKTSTSTSALYGYSVLIAIGAGLVSQTAYSVAPARVQPHQVPAAIGFINVAQIGGIVIALTVSGTVFQNIAAIDLGKVLYPLGYTSSDVQGAIAGSQSTLFEKLAPAARASAVEAIVQAIDQTYALVIAAGALTLVSSVFLRREKLFMEVAAGA